MNKIRRREQSAPAATEDAATRRQEFAAHERVRVENVPTGLYEVRAVLMGPGGPIAKTMQLVKVEPAAGSTR